MMISMRKRLTALNPLPNDKRGFLGWEMFLVIALVFGVTAFALFMLRKSYKACTDEGYGLLECIFNAPAEDPYDTKNKEAAAVVPSKTPSRLR